MVIRRSLIYSLKDEQRILHIYLPDDYFTVDKRYPVLYFFDGHNLFYNEDATFGKSWGLKEFLDAWKKQVIVVGLSSNKDGNERISEYLPYLADKGSRFEHTIPLGDLTIQWILHEVKPYIDHEYRTLPFRETTGIAGSSMGGLMSLYAVINYNEWFSKAACVSSSIGYCMSALTNNLCHCGLLCDSRIYLSWGSREARDSRNPECEDLDSTLYRMNKSVADTIRSKGANVVMHCQRGGGHREMYWEKLVPEFMDFLWID